jgi:RluA family pseudouridine synthase
VCPDLPGRVLYRDGLILIIDKPAGLPVHAGPKGGLSLEALFDTLRFGLPAPPALAHRLDRDTSGCLVLGRHRKALARLGRLFQAGAVEKTYWAVVKGRPASPEGRIDLALAKRSTERRGWWMKPDPAGRPAVTDYRVMGEGPGIAWLELRPRTGRTHQIRVHCEALGCPVVGDPVYGERQEDGKPRETWPPLQLHARAIALPLYPGKPPVRAEAPVPPHMGTLLEACGWSGPDEAPQSSLDPCAPAR